MSEGGFVESEIADLLRDAADLIRRLHHALPDEGGVMTGLAPSWWELGVESNGMQARISNLLRTTRTGRGQS